MPDSFKRTDVEGRRRRAREAPPPYEIRYLALIDVLGWSNIVSDSVDNKQVHGSIAEGAELVCMASEWAAEITELGRPFRQDDASLEVRGTHFSDTFALSFPNEGWVDAVVFTMVSSLCLRLLECGHYTRGAIVKGLLTHTESTLYGPALVEAAGLEKNVAKHPRILVTADAEPVCLGRSRIDFDGLTYLDIGLPFGWSQEHEESLERLIDMAELRKRAESRDMNHFSKHSWMHRYLSDARERYLATRPPSSRA